MTQKDDHSVYPDNPLSAERRALRWCSSCTPGSLFLPQWEEASHPYYKHLRGRKEWRGGLRWLRTNTRRFPACWCEEAAPTVCKDDDGVTMLLKGLFSDSLLNESHPLQNGLEGHVQVCSCMLRCRWKPVSTRMQQPALSLETHLRSAWPTFYREFFQLLLHIDLLAVKKVENADDFGELGREEEKLVVWTHAEGGDLWRCEADAARVIVGADTCSAAGTHVIDAAPTARLCFKLQMSVLLLSNRFRYQQNTDPCPEPHTEEHQSRLWCVIHNEIASNCCAGSQTGLRYYCPALWLPSEPLKTVWDSVNDDRKMSQLLHPAKKKVFCFSVVLLSKTPSSSSSS